MAFVKKGPIGRSSNTDLRWDDGPQGDPKMILISYSDKRVLAVQFIYASTQGYMLSSDHGMGGKKFASITLSGSLTCVSGHYDSNNITSLKFVCSRETYGPYGKESGEYFEFKANSRASIVGFHGRQDSIDGRLTTIGVHIKIILDRNIFFIPNKKIKKEI